MNYINFRSVMKDFPIFNVGDVRAADAGFDGRRLHEWQAKGYIRKIAKGCYLFSDVDIDEFILFRTANRLYAPSYISLETALAYYQLIPESVYGITSVTTRRTYRFDTPLTHFVYRTVVPRLFFGYRILPTGTRLAMLEKSLLDLFYLNPNLSEPRAFADLRIDRDALHEQLDRPLLSTQLQRIGKQAVTSRVSQFLEWIQHA